MDNERFISACEDTLKSHEKRSGIGTLSEKTMHAVLKRYFESNADNQEIKIGNFVADIVNENGIIEIQTAAFNLLRKKLAAFMELCPVTIVHPIARTKWLILIDPETGEQISRRKSPKKGSEFDIFAELYKIKPFLLNENFRLCIMLIDVEEQRTLNFVYKKGRKNSTRFNRIPTALADEIYIETTGDFKKLIPPNLLEIFTSKDFRKSAKITLRQAQTALNVLTHIGAVERIGKEGNLYQYCVSEN